MKIGRVYLCGVILIGVLKYSIVAASDFRISHAQKTFIFSVLSFGVGSQSKAKNCTSLKISCSFVIPPLNAMRFLCVQMLQRNAVPITFWTFCSTSAPLDRIFLHKSSVVNSFPGHHSIQDVRMALTILEVEIYKYLDQCLKNNFQNIVYK